MTCGGSSLYRYRGCPTSIYYIYIFGQYMKFPHSPKVPRNFHISQRKKKEKLHITTIMKKETKIILHIIINYPPLPL
jgi:hypothetical protein